MRSYGALEGIMARIKGVGVSIKLLDPNTNKMKSVVVNKQSLEDYMKRNGVASFQIDGHKSNELASQINTMLSGMKGQIQERTQKRETSKMHAPSIKAIVYSQDGIHATPDEMKKFFTSLNKAGVQVSSEIQKRTLERSTVDGLISLSQADVDQLKGPASELLKKMPDVAHDVDESTQGAVKPATLDEIKKFKFIGNKAEQMIDQLSEKTPAMKGIVDGALQNKQNAQALLKKIIPGLKDKKTVADNLGVLKDLKNQDARDIFNKLIVVAGWDQKQ